VWGNEFIPEDKEFHRALLSVKVEKYISPLYLI
jgi:hypothetical protein